MSHSHGPSAPAGHHSGRPAPIPFSNTQPSPGYGPWWTPDYDTSRPRLATSSSCGTPPNATTTPVKRRLVWSQLKHTPQPARVSDAFSTSPQYNNCEELPAAHLQDSPRDPPDQQQASDSCYRGLYEHWIHSYLSSESDSDNNQSPPPFEASPREQFKQASANAYAGGTDVYNQDISLSSQHRPFDQGTTFAGQSFASPHMNTVDPPYDWAAHWARLQRTHSVSAPFLSHDDVACHLEQLHPTVLSNNALTAPATTQGCWPTTDFSTDAWQPSATRGEPIDLTSPRSQRRATSCVSDSQTTVRQPATKSGAFKRSESSQNKHSLLKSQSDEESPGVAGKRGASLHRITPTPRRRLGGCGSHDTTRLGSGTRQAVESAPTAKRSRSKATIYEKIRNEKINTALDKLRQLIPGELQAEQRPLSKVKTIRLATSYIAALGTMIGCRCEAHEGVAHQQALGLQPLNR